MSLRHVFLRGMPGFQFMKSGKVYVYQPGNLQSKESARNKALKQGRAILRAKIPR